MSSLVFILYLFIFCYIITRIKFFTKAGLDKGTLIFLFCIKVFAGLLYAKYYLLPANYPGSDTYRFFRSSLVETDILLKNPFLFFKELFTHQYNNSGNIFIANQSYWNDLKSNIIIKLLAIINVFTFKNYNAAIVFFNFLFLFGLVGFYKLIQDLVPTNKWLLVIGIFFIPSFLFWSSGIHKDGLIFSAIGIVLWQFHVSLKNKFTVKSVFIILTSMVLIFGLRNFIFFILLINLIAWSFSYKSGKIFVVFGLVYLIALILFFASTFVSPKINLPNYVVIKHQEFSQLSGRSSFTTKELKPTTKSFIKYLPTALDVVLLKPHFNEIKNKTYLLAFIENALLGIFIFISLLYRKRKVSIPVAFWGCWFFALSLFIIEGYTITFLGAIVRYKSLGIPLITTPLLALIDIKKIQNSIRKIIL